MIEKLVKEQEWSQDCQDKWDFDFPILEVSTRIYGVNGGMIVFHNGELEDYKTHPNKWKNKNASGTSSFVMGEETILTSEEIKADTNEECKTKIEEWIINNYDKAMNIIINKHQKKG